MKTVKDYLDLGLVFVGDDMPDGIMKVSDVGAASLNANDCFGGMEVVGEFAWRNNDGVKPKYKGLIDVCFECGTVSHNESAIDFEWSLDDENYIAKWRPVVSMHNHTELKPRHSFVTAISIDGPKFWNKSMPSFNCPCVAVNIETSKPTVSPKEDKQMKPVYTAEMHAKNELPPVGSECEALCMDATNSKHVWVKSKILMNHEGNECAVYCVDAGVLRWADEFRLIPKTIKVNGFDVPAPMSEAPEHRQMVYLAHAANVDFNLDFTWQGDDASVSWLSRGLIHSTKSAAIAHAKAMLGIDPNA